jgi:hypothetical protein
MPSSTLQLVMRDAAIIVAGGLTIGVCISLATTQLLEKMEFNQTESNRYLGSCLQ